MANQLFEDLLRSEEILSNRLLCFQEISNEILTTFGHQPMIGPMECLEHFRLKKKHLHSKKNHRFEESFFP